MHSAPAVPSAVAPDAAAPSRVRRSVLVDRAVLALIGVIVVLVSLPRLRRFALHENEIDAIRAIRTLADEALARAHASVPPRLADLVPTIAGRRARLEDLEVLEDGRLRRHGYVFAWAEGEARGGTAIVAWPWEHGRTGLAAFAIELGGPLLGLENADGRYSGPRRPPPAPARAALTGDAVAWTPISAD